MPNYEVRFNVPTEVVVQVEADDEDAAADAAWEIGQHYLDTLDPWNRGPAIIYADLDGIGADDVEEID